MSFVIPSLGIYLKCENSFKLVVITNFVEARKNFFVYWKSCLWHFWDFQCLLFCMEKAKSHAESKMNPKADFEKVPIIDLHRDNFNDFLPSIIFALQDASFIALDCVSLTINPNDFWLTLSVSSTSTSQQMPKTSHRNINLLLILRGTVLSLILF